MKIIRSISWTFFANLIVSFTKWMILVLIANLLSPLEVGVYSLAFAVSAPITLFANMKLRSLYITEEKYGFSNYIRSRNIVTVFTFFVLILVAFLIYPDYMYIIILVGLSKIFDLQSDMYYAIPHKFSAMDIIGKLMISKHVLMLIGFSLVLLMSRDLTLSLLGLLIIQVVFLFLLEKKVIMQKYKYSNFPISFESIKKILLLGIPLGLVQMIFSINNFLPRYLLEFFESAEVLGYFSAIAYIMILGNMMVSAVSQNFLPVLTNKINGKQYKSFKKIVYIKLSIFSLLLGFLLISGSWLFGELFLNLIYGPNYARYSDVLIIMSFAITINFLSWNFDTALLSMRYISVQPKISLFVLIINMFLSYFLIREYGVHGAAYTLIIINSIQLVLRIFFVNKRLVIFSSV